MGADARGKVGRIVDPYHCEIDNLDVTHGTRYARILSTIMFHYSVRIRADFAREPLSAILTGCAGDMVDA